MEERSSLLSLLAPFSTTERLRKFFVTVVLRPMSSDPAALVVFARLPIPGKTVGRTGGAIFGFISHYKIITVHVDDSPYVGLRGWLGIGWATSSRLGQPPARVLVAWPVRVSACAVPKGLMGSIWYRSSLERSACVPCERRAWRVAVRCRAGRDPLRIIAERPRRYSCKAVRFSQVPRPPSCFAK